MTPSSVTLEVSRLVVEPDDYPSTRCPACEGALSFLQPDARQPYRLLGICDDCDAWFLIDLARAEILHLPGGEGPRE
jgi:hypothetical protein